MRVRVCVRVCTVVAAPTQALRKAEQQSRELENKLSEGKQQQALLQLEMAALKETMASMQKELDAARTLAQTADQQLKMQQAAERLTSADWAGKIDNEDEGGRTARNKQKPAPSVKSDRSWSLVQEKEESRSMVSLTSSRQTKGSKIDILKGALTFSSTYYVQPEIAHRAKAAKSILEALLLVWDFRSNRPDKADHDIKRLKGDTGKPATAFKNCVVRRILRATEEMYMVALRLTQAKLVATDGREIEVKGKELPVLLLGKRGDLGKFLLKHLRDLYLFLVSDRNAPDELFRGKGKEAEPAKEKGRQMAMSEISAEDMAVEKKEQLQRENELLRHRPKPRAQHAASFGQSCLVGTCSQQSAEHSQI